MAVKTDATITVARAYAVAAAFFLVALVIFFIPYWLLWGSPLRAELDASLLLFILAFILGVVVHEALHGVGLVLFGRVPWGAVRFGVNWKALMPIAHCNAPLSSSSYRYALLLPGIALGIVPGVIGLVLGISWATLFGAAMFAGAGGDFVAVWAIRSVPASARVIDHPEKVGCQVLIE